MLFVRRSARSSNRSWCPLLQQGLAASMGVEGEGLMIVGGSQFIETTVAVRRSYGSFPGCCWLVYFTRSHLFSAACSSNRAVYVSLHIIAFVSNYNIVHSVIFTCIILFQSSPCVISTCIRSRIYLPTREQRYSWEG
jgi:hypothetical protein